MKASRLIFGVIWFAAGSVWAQQNAPAKPADQPKNGEQICSEAGGYLIHCAQVTLKVVAAKNNQPIPDAHIVVRFTEARMLFPDKSTSWETKTNRQGVASLPPVPYGHLKVQVIAKGFQTYGDVHQVGQPEQEITIPLQPPKGQVSSY